MPIIDTLQADIYVNRPAAAAESTPTSTTYSPAGAANAGLGSSGALSIRPLSALTSVGSGLLALFALAL
jgi:hypothetical protein